MKFELDVVNRIVKFTMWGRVLDAMSFDEFKHEFGWLALADMIMQRRVGRE